MNSTIATELDLSILKSQFIHLRKVSSTNSFLLTKPKDHGTILIADKQSAGHGRQGKTWNSKDSKGLEFSILLKKHITNLPPYIYTYLIATSIIESLEKIAPELTPKLKWPNDVLIKDKKVAGILVETKRSTNSISRVVIGVGINLNHEEKFFESKDLANGTSLRIHTDKKYNRLETLKKIIKQIDSKLLDAINNDDNNIIDEWKQYSKNIGDEVKIVKNNLTNKGIFKDLSKDGALILEKNGNKKKYYTGEVSLRGK